MNKASISQDRIYGWNIKWNMLWYSQ